MSNREALTEAQSPRQPEPPMSGLAIASISLGALTLLPVAAALFLRSADASIILVYYFLVGAPAVLAIVFGAIANGATKRGERRGYGMANWGVALGLLALIAPYVAGLIATAEARG